MFYIDHTHILLVMHTICCLAGYLLGSFVCLLVLFVVSLCHIGTVTNTIVTDSFFSHCYLFSWFFNCKCDMAVTDIIVALCVLSWFYAHLTVIVFTAVVSGVFMLVRSIGT